ncbi:MAG: PA domain-containing protein, partial [Planctomycetaceae bacterium]
EQQLAGLVDTNAADLTLASNGVFNPSGIINWNQDAGGAGDVGNFRADSTPAFPDDPIPGIPGIGSFVDRRTDNIAGELITYVEFPAAGVYSMGVNSDDGFSVTATDQPPADNLGLYVQAGGQTSAYYAASGGTDKGGVFRPITAPLVGKLVIADPPLADAPIKNVAAIAGNIAVIDRGVNTFSAKVGFAREAGAIGVVIVNNRDPDSADGKFPIVMGGALVDLPAVMISRPQGAALKASMAAGEATARIAPDTTRYLGSFDGGRGASDSIFAFNVAQAGVYPLRLVWFEGGGGANLEWFSVTAAGDKVPLNAPGNPAALKAFRARAFVPPPPVDPTVAAAYDGTDVVITFQGKLQSSPTVDGPFTDVTATSPLRVPAASAAGNLFYRARR